MTEKTMGEEELKGLESEIDAAVDRLFVEKQLGPIISPQVEFPSPLEFEEAEKPFDLEKPPSDFPSSSPSTPMERLEMHLLSLEWEITKEAIEHAKEEILALQKAFRESVGLSMVLNQMSLVLDHMIRNKEGIQPLFIGFLLDSKETVKLLMRNEEEEAVQIYKKLALEGIKARYHCLEGLKEPEPKPQYFFAPKEEEEERTLSSTAEWKERVSQKTDLLLQKMDEMMNKLDHQVSLGERTAESRSELFESGRASTVKVTVFKTGEKLFGVESNKVFKLFKVPVHLYEKFIQLPKVRLRGLEIKMVDLENYFPNLREYPGRENQLLILKDNGEFKGLIIDRVLKRLSAPSEAYFSGSIRWRHENTREEIPILNFKNL